MQFNIMNTHHNTTCITKLEYQIVFPKVLTLWYEVDQVDSYETKRRLVLQETTPITKYIYQMQQRAIIVAKCNALNQGSYNGVSYIHMSVTLVHVPVAVLIREDSTVGSLQLEHLGTLRCEGVPNETDGVAQQ